MNLTLLQETQSYLSAEGTLGQWGAPDPPPALLLPSTEAASQPTSICAPRSRGAAELNSCLIRSHIPIRGTLPRKPHALPRGFSASPVLLTRRRTSQPLRLHQLRTRANYQDRGSSGNGDGGGNGKGPLR